MAVCVCMREYLILSCSLVGPPSTPIITNMTSRTTSINLVWSQGAGDVVDSYTISYSYTTRECDGTVLGSDTITGIDGSIRVYSLSNIEENSDFDISITAVNGAGRSPVPARTYSTTLVAGEIFMPTMIYTYCVAIYHTYTHTHIHTHTRTCTCILSLSLTHTPAAPSGFVTSLMTTAITSTTVSISWGRVPCKDRNAAITRYALIYGPSSDSSVRSGIFVMDINTNNVYTITGLLPRTGYTIQVRADHATVFGTLDGIMSATVNEVTAVPEGEAVV